MVQTIRQIIQKRSKRNRRTIEAEVIRLATGLFRHLCEISLPPQRLPTTAVESSGSRCVNHRNDHARTLRVVD